MAREIDFAPIEDLDALQTQFDWEQWLKTTLPALGWNMTVVRAVSAAYQVKDYDGVMDTFEAAVNDIIRVPAHTTPCAPLPLYPLPLHPSPLSPPLCVSSVVECEICRTRCGG